MTSDLGTGPILPKKLEICTCIPIYWIYFPKPFLFSYRFEAAVAARREEASRGPSEEA